MVTVYGEFFGEPISSPHEVSAGFISLPCTFLHTDHSIKLHHHMSNSLKCMGVNRETLQLHAVYKKLYFLLQVMQEFVSVLQVTCAASECAMKLKVCMTKSLLP